MKPVGSLVKMRQWEILNASLETHMVDGGKPLSRGWQCPRHWPEDKEHDSSPW